MKTRPLCFTALAFKARRAVALRFQGDPVADHESAAMQWLSERLAGENQRTYSKPDPDHTFRGRLDGSRAKADEVVYEDDGIFAFRHHVDPSVEEWWETHVVIIPKRWVPTLLDMGPGEAELWARLIGGIQKVAISLRLDKTGFMIRAGILPPYQHTEHVHIHILSGKHTSPSTDGPLDVS